jgi:hypothetical protein
MQVSDTSGFTNAPTGLYPYGAVMSWRTENHSYQMYASHTGDLAYKTQWNNDNYSGWLTPMVYGRNGNSSSGKTVYGSIYYDTDNTGYYIDPHATSNLNVLNVIGGNVVKGDSAQGRSTNSGNMNSLADPSGFYYAVGPTGAPNAEWYNWINCMGDSWGGTDRYGFQIAHQFWNEDQLYVRRVQSGGWQTWRRIFTEGSVDVRAPIFYDRDNTAYYVDAASTSVLNTVQFGSNPTTGGGGGRIIPSTGSPYSLRQEFGSDNSGWRYGIAKNVSGTVTVMFYVQDNGDCVATGNVTAYSDVRIKANVETIPGALDKLDQIRGVTYTRTDMDDKERRYAGVIAQEIEAVLPEAVGGDEDIKTVDYNATIALLIQAVKELQIEVETVKSRLH